jgi:hypothetical protein
MGKMASVITETDLFHIVMIWNLQVAMNQLLLKWQEADKFYIDVLVPGILAKNVLPEIPDNHDDKDPILWLCN